MKNIIREELLLKVLLEGRLEDIIKKYFFKKRSIW
jgi:hypothetical protein